MVSNLFAVDWLAFGVRQRDRVQPTCYGTQRVKQLISFRFWFMFIYRNLTTLYTMNRWVFESRQPLNQFWSGKNGSYHIVDSIFVFLFSSDTSKTPTPKKTYFRQSLIHPNFFDKWSVRWIDSRFHFSCGLSNKQGREGLRYSLDLPLCKKKNAFEYFWI